MVITDYTALMIIGGIFLLIGIAIMIWGSKENKEDIEAITNRIDVRKYLEGRADTYQSWGLKVGGIISIVIGLILLIMGIIFMIWG